MSNDLAGVVTADPHVPGAVAVATDRGGLLYQGAAGERVLGGADLR